MSDHEIQTYLSQALDQEACKDTLTTALNSRILSLQNWGIPTARILDSLETLHEDPYQINDDVIFTVIETLVIASLESPDQNR